MRRAGTAVGTAQGLIVVRGAGDPVEIGTALVDDSLQGVGRVVDVFGPVEKPYLAVSPEIENPATLVGSQLYTQH